MQTSLMIEIGGLLLMSAATLRAAASVSALAGRRLKLSRLNREYLREFDRLTEKSLEAHKAERLRRDHAWEGTRKFRIARRMYDSADKSICSFYLQPYDGRPLPPFEPGQFLTFQLPVPGQRQPLTRSYSLSESPTEEGYYRVSIKRIAHPVNAVQSPPVSASNFFHDSLPEGAIVEAYAPSGSFTLDAQSDRPLVFIAGGVGLTPFISMLNWLIATGSQREIWLFYGARNSADHLMAAHLEAARRVHPQFRSVVAYSRPGPRCRKGRDYDVVGHIGINLMAPLLRARDCDVYLCGPQSMMAQMTNDLARFGLPATRLRLEKFVDGRNTQPVAQAPAPSAPDGRAVGQHARPVTVGFARSGKQVKWDPNAGSILELAEAGGIKTRSGCRQGICGLCTTPIREGKVDYFRRPAKDPAPGTCLLCVTRPTSNVVLEL